MLRIIEKLDETKNEFTQKCMVVDISDASKTEFETVLTHEEIDLIQLLNQIQHQCKLYSPMMNELWSKIQKYSKAQNNDTKN